MEEKEVLLSVRDLEISFGNKKESVEVVHAVSFDVLKGEVLGIVGESGSGKSVTSLGIMGLLPNHNTKITGSINFETTSLTSLDTKELQKIRGREISMIFQEPMTALNPSLKCGKQVSEILRHHLKLSS